MDFTSLADQRLPETETETSGLFSLRQASNRNLVAGGSDQFSNLLGRLGAWQIPTDAVDRVHDLARASLNEVKALTEYEDGKVSRLLTVITFLSAVVAAVFTRFASAQ